MNMNSAHHFPNRPKDEIASTTTGASSQLHLSLIDYGFVHEHVHPSENIQDTRFWRQVEKPMPDFDHCRLTAVARGVRLWKGGGDL